MSVIPLHPAWLCRVHRHVSGESMYGAVVALRNDGEQALFAPKSGGPLAWVSIGTISLEESLILTPRQVKKHLGIEDWSGDEE